MKPKKLEITYRGQSLHIEYFLRPGVKGAVLYLHGLSCSKNDFTGATTAGELNPYTLAAFDFPGCGNSSYPENMALGIDDLVEITNIAVSKLPLGDLVLIGHSMGGLAALLYIQKYSENVKGFINIEGNLASEDCFLSREVIKYSFTEFKDRWFQNLKQKSFCSKNKGFQKYAETLEKYSSPKAFFDCCPSLVDYSDNGNLVRLFTELKIPKIFMHGSENNKLSYIPQLRNKGCDIVEIASSNHFPGYDNPQDYYKVISNFLNKT